jgi:hypothetical protein
MFISNLPDGIDKLWCTFTVGSFNPGYFLNPLTHPDLAGTYSYWWEVGTAGEVTFPYDDGGIPEQTAAYLTLTTVGAEITANKFMSAYYGLDSAPPTESLGFINSNIEILTFGSPYGVTGNEMQVKVQLGVTAGVTTSPYLRSVIVNYLKIPDPRESFDFTIDLDETAVAEVKPLEAVIGSLNYVRSKRTLSPFFYGMMATKNVRILEQPSAEDVDKEDYFMGERGGFVRVRCAEII